MKLLAAVTLAIAVGLYSMAAPCDDSKFTVIILGTRSAQDVEVIEKNLRALPYVTLFIPTMVSQMHLEFEGSMAAEDDVMIADVASLAADRYDVVAKRESKRGLVITLRKIKE
ncbi:MAG: hypothetical protein WC683_09190 [bacterium]